MPDPHRTINSLVTAIADGARVDWGFVERAGTRGTNSDLVRQFRIIAAVGAGNRDTARAAGPAWPRALSAAWATVVWVAGAKVAVAAWAAFASASLPALWPFALILLLFGLSGTLLIAGGTDDRRVRSLGALYIIIASAFASPLMPQSDAGIAGAYIGELRRLPFDAFLPLALWLFVGSFPAEPAGRLARRLTDGFVAGSACVGTLLFTSSAWRVEGIAGAWRVLEPDAPAPAYWLMLFAATAALPYLAWRLRVATVEAQPRGALVIAAGITPILLTVIATPWLPAPGDPFHRVAIGWVLYGALLSVIPSTAYAVVVHRALDVRLTPRKTIQHALARYGVWIASVVPLTYLVADMYLHRASMTAELEVHGQPTALFGLALAGFAILMFRERLLQAVDGWFLRGAVDYAEALARIEHGLRDARSVREIAGLLAGEIDRAIHPAAIAVFLVDEDGNELVALDGTGRPLSTKSVLVELLRLVRGDIQLHAQADGPMARLLPSADRAWLADEGFTLLCPLIDSADRLLGMIALGEPMAGLPYGKQDRHFVRAISGRAAIQLENRWLREFAGDDRDRPQQSGAVAAVNWDNEPGAQCPECGAMWSGTVAICSCRTPTVPAALPVVVKGKFRVERLISSGGMGIVYQGIDETLGRRVAIKTLPGMAPDRAAGLQREARTMASVLHPNLALIFGAEHWRGKPLLIVEYLEGGTLADYLQRGVLQVEEVVDLGIVLADVLDRVHASGVLHRDIKPSNIGYTRDGIPKLLDFGVAAMLDRGLTPAAEPELITDIIERSQPLQTFATSTWRVVGTPLYLSPEAVAGQVPQPSFDLWGLSLVLYEALTGRHPFADESVAHVIARIQATKIPDVRDFRPDCPPELAALLHDSLSPVLVRRPATAGELRIRLQRLRAGLNTTSF